MLADYSACGIDPKKTKIFAHSAVPALNQLMLPFLTLVSNATGIPTANISIVAYDVPIFQANEGSRVKASDVVQVTTDNYELTNNTALSVDDLKLIVDRFEL